MENSIAYMLMILFLALCAFQYEYTEKRKKQSVIVALCLVVFFIFFGFRGYVFTDCFHYYQIFMATDWRDFSEWTLFNDSDDEKVTEIGFLFLMCICKSLSDSFFVFTAVIAGFNTVLFYRFLSRWHIDNIPFAMIVFISFWGLNIMFDLMRNSIAIFIFVNSLEYVYDKKPILYFSLCFLALLFHFSAIIFFPLYFILRIRINKWVFLTVFLVMFVFFVAHQSFIELLIKVLRLDGTLGLMFKLYTEVYDTSRPFSTYVTLEHFVLCGLVFLYYDEIINRYKHRVIIINSLAIYFIMFYLLSDFYIMSIRMSTLFVFSYWVLWYDVIKVMAIRNNKILLSSYLLLYGLFIVFANNQTPVYKYDNVLFGADSYEHRLSVYNTYFSSIGQ